MTKPLAILLACLLLLTMAGCSQQEQEVLFYYPRAEVIYGQADGVIASEARDISGHDADVRHLLNLYLEGPLSQTLANPFPSGTAIDSMESQGDTLLLTLSEQFSTLEGLDYTIACTCISRTCFGIHSCEAVEITSGNRSMMLNRDTVALVDTAASADPTD